MDRDYREHRENTEPVFSVDQHSARAHGGGLRITTVVTDWIVIHREHRENTEPVTSVARKPARVHGGGPPLAALLAVAAVAVFCNWPMLVHEDHAGGDCDQPRRRAAEPRDAWTKPSTDYQRAIALQPDYAPAYNNLGTARRAQRDGCPSRRRVSTRAHLSAAISRSALQPGERADRRRQGEGSGGAFPRRAAGDAGLGRRPQQPRHRADGGGKHDEAIIEFRAAVAADPASREVAPQPRRRARVGAQDRRGAASSSARAARLAPGDGAIRYDLGSFLLEIDRTEEAIQSNSALALKLIAALRRSAQQSGHRARDAAAGCPMRLRTSAPPSPSIRFSPTPSVISRWRSLRPNSNWRRLAGILTRAN